MTESDFWKSISCCPKKNKLYYFAVCINFLKPAYILGSIDKVNAPKNQMQELCNVQEVISDPDNILSNLYLAKNPYPPRIIKTYHIAYWSEAPELYHQKLTNDPYDSK